jgi:hypothetical protein
MTKNKRKLKTSFNSCFFYESEDVWVMSTHMMQDLGFIKCDDEGYYFVPSPRTNGKKEWGLSLDSRFIFDLSKFMKQLEKRVR